MDHYTHPHIASARHKRCNVISGRQLMRTGTIDDLTPAEV